MNHLEHFLVDVLSLWQRNWGASFLVVFSLHRPVHFLLERFYFWIFSSSLTAFEMGSLCFWICSRGLLMASRPLSLERTYFSIFNPIFETRFYFIRCET